MIESNYVLLRGPSVWRIDNRQVDLNFTHAAPLILNIPNCRKYNTFIVRGDKKIICCYQKHPTLFLFLRDSDNRSQLKIKNLMSKMKIKYTLDTTQRIFILILYDKLAGHLCGISDELFIDCKKKIMEQRTSQVCSKFANAARQI